MLQGKRKRRNQTSCHRERSVKRVGKVREGVGKPVLVPAFWVSVASCLPISISLPRDLGRLWQPWVATRLGLQLDRQGKDGTVQGPGSAMVTIQVHWVNSKFNPSKIFI